MMEDPEEPGSPSSQGCRITSLTSSLVKFLQTILVIVILCFLIESSTSSETSSPAKECKVYLCNYQYFMAEEARKRHHQEELQEQSSIQSSKPSNSHSLSNRPANKRRNGRRRRINKKPSTAVNPLDQLQQDSPVDEAKSSQRKDEYCSQLFQYNQCMRSLSKECRGHIDYHSVLTIVRKWMQQERCNGSHHKTRQGVRTGNEDFLKQEEARFKAMKEKFRIKRCIDSVKNYTFMSISNPKTSSSVSTTNKKSAKNLVRQSRILSSHASIYDTEDLVDEEPDEEDDDNLNEEDEKLIGKVMSPEAQLTAEELSKLYDRDSEPLICSIFGDPHLRTFKNEFESCRTLGAWPLVDHPLFAVQVTNSKKEESNHHVSGVSKVTVVIKNFLICGIDRDLVYEASLDKEDEDKEDFTMKSKFSLPIEFIDGSSSTRNSMVKVTARSDNEVCIQMDHIGVQVCVYHTDSSSFLNVIIKFKKMMSGEERRSMIEVMEQRSLCTQGCPTRERIDIQTILDKVGVLPQPQLLYNYKQVTNRSQAGIQEECFGLQGYYYLACLFDVKMKGSTKDQINAHRFMQEMDDISIVKRSLSLKTLMSLTSESSSAKSVINQLHIDNFYHLLLVIMISILLPRLSRP